MFLLCWLLIGYITWAVNSSAEEAANKGGRRKDDG